MFFQKWSSRLKKFIKERKRSLLSSVAAAFLGALVTSVDEIYSIIHNNRTAIKVLQNNYSKDNGRITQLEINMSNTVKDTSWLAYIQRKDTEYHMQQTINHQLFNMLGIWSGKQEEDEKMQFELMRYSLTPEMLGGIRKRINRDSDYLAKEEKN